MLTCTVCGSSAHRDDADERRCDSCEKIVRLCSCDAGARKYYSCQGWGNGWDGASCFEGWEASPWVDGPSYPLTPCPSCKQRVPIDPELANRFNRI